jgi:rhodanese-related sulfurtransferase
MNYKIIILAVLIMILVIILWGYLGRSSEFDVDEAKYDELSKEPNTVILDVRTAGEFSQGKIPGAILIDIHSSNFKDQVTRLDKSKTYLIYCRSGNRSAKACEIMSKLGFEKCFNLKHGIKGWVKNNKPVVN